MKGEKLSKSRWVPPLKDKLRLSQSKPHWVPPPTVVQNTTNNTNTQSTAPRWVPPTTARVNQANPVTLTLNTSTSRSTTRETLPSTITYPPLPFDDEINGSPKSFSCPSGTRSTIHKDKATERRANLPSTITYPRLVTRTLDHT
jgi:hypothetical protein